MKKPLFLFSGLWLLAMLVTCRPAQAQLQNRLPPFGMMLTNGKLFTTAGLSQYKPTVLIYFAPDCEHCQVLLKAFFKKPEAFKNAEVLLVTFKPVKELIAFEKSFHTHAYANVHVGAETNPLYLQSFFNLQKTPFTALYDKAKNLLASYKNDTPVDELMMRLKAIK